VDPFLDQFTARGILGAMITPAVLISASGTLTLSTSNRLGRVVDRIRVLQSEAEELKPDALDPETVEKRTLISGQLAHLTVRIHFLQTAITILYVAIGLLVGTSIAIGASATANWAFGWLPVGMGLLGATALFFASMLLVREARLAVRSTLLEVEYVKRVVARRTGLPEAAIPNIDLTDLLPGGRWFRKLLTARGRNDQPPPG
jgi:hypothetical protein